MHSTRIPRTEAHTSPKRKQGAVAVPTAHQTDAQTPPVRPSWNADRRELRYTGLLVKRFRVPAPNQQLFLDAFEEDGWSACIDDPLPPKGDQTRQDRMHATIKSLNGCQENPLIKFHANGTGHQIFWEIRTPPPAPKRRPKRRRSAK